MAERKSTDWAGVKTPNPQMIPGLYTWWTKKKAAGYMVTDENKIVNMDLRSGMISSIFNNKIVHVREASNEVSHAI